MRIPDSHAHLVDRKFSKDRDEVVRRAFRADVSPILIPCAPEEFSEGLSLRGKYPSIYLAVGLHPHHAKEWNNEIRELIDKAALTGAISAIGEIGLDYYYNFSPREKQRDVLKYQLEIAEKYSLPVVIHSRKSAEDLANLIEKFNTNGVLHSFSEETWLADLAISLGYFISFSGMITFKWGDFIREVASKAPENRILVETDSPYLAPEPYRGKRNEPIYVHKVGEKLAEVRGKTQEEIFPSLLKNFYMLFGGKNGETEEKAQRDRW